MTSDVVPNKNANIEIAPVENYVEYLRASEDDIRNAFVELAIKDKEMSIAQREMNAALRNKEAPLTPADLGLLGKAMQPQELQEKLGAIKAARDKAFIEAQDKFLIAQHNFRIIGIIVDGIKEIVANRQVCLQK